MDFDSTVVRVPFSHLRSRRGSGWRIKRALLALFALPRASPAGRGRFAAILNNPGQFALADHGPTADFGPLQAPLGKPCVHGPFAYSTKPLRDLVNRQKHI